MKTAIRMVLAVALAFSAVPAVASDTFQAFSPRPPQSKPSSRPCPMTSLLPSRALPSEAYRPSMSV